MQQGLTRREALKRGALLAGGIAWATPVVQVVGMSPAYAQIPSPGEEVDCCIGPDGKTARLASVTMEYLGDTNFCSESDFTQDESLVSCTDFPSPPVDPLPDPAHIVASHQESIFENDGVTLRASVRIWFDGPVAAGATFVIDASNAFETRLKGETWVHVFDGSVAEANYRQKVAFHTSCSEPLFTGDQFGSVVVVGCTADTTLEVSELQEPETTEELPEPETTEEGASGSEASRSPGQGPKIDPGNASESQEQEETTEG